MQVTTASPAQIDAEIARINGEISALQDRIERATVSAKRWSESHMAAYYADNIRDAEVTAAEARKALPALIVEAAPLHAEYDRRGGWTRWYLVEGGHLHYDVSSFRCSRIIGTSHYWLTEQSGKPAEEVIELAGDRVCTVCFPAAPVAVQNRPSQLLTKSEQEKAQDRRKREEAREEKARKAAEKGITDPNTGGPLVIRSGNHNETIKTQRAAEIELVSQLWYQKYYSAPEDRDMTVRQLVAALAAKKDTTPEVELADAHKRLTARIKRESR